MYSFGDFIGTDNTLPLLENNKFDAKANGKNVLLTWATSSEKNASHFELQVSVDGKNFKPIAKVKATGNTNSTKEYNYNHFDAFELANTLYYRLKSVDVDGESNGKAAIVTLNKQQ
ncbi:MAG: discoidin domain-containing protein [Chitinophagales bacterium]|nr:discoidin domain-containing protein [Chitinophagales bacterium]